MHMKDFVKLLIPPLLPKILKRRPPIFRSYNDASVACQNAGYEGTELIRVVVEKNAIFKQKIQSNPVLDLGDLRTLVGVGLASAQDSLRVLDFGGGCGYHYVLARAAFGNSKNLRWNVVETSAMVKAAQHLADAGLQFFDHIDDAKNNLGQVDLVLTSGALQYCPDPLEFLKTLTQVGAKYIFITRTPLHDSEDNIISIQVSRLWENGPGPLPSGFEDKNVSYPITFASRREVEKILAETYEIRFSIKEEKGTFRAGKQSYDMYGYFCERK
jgi:putative methyltransferase (TIGR04325 family)